MHVRMCVNYSQFYFVHDHCTGVMECVICWFPAQPGECGLLGTGRACQSINRQTHTHIHTYTHTHTHTYIHTHTHTHTHTYIHTHTHTHTHTCQWKRTTQSECMQNVLLFDAIKLNASLPGRPVLTRSYLAQKSLSAKTIHKNGWFAINSTQKSLWKVCRFKVERLPDLTKPLILCQYVYGRSANIQCTFKSIRFSIHSSVNGSVTTKE